MRNSLIMVALVASLCVAWVHPLEAKKTSQRLDKGSRFSLIEKSKGGFLSDEKNYFEINRDGSHFGFLAEPQPAFPVSSERRNIREGYLIIQLAVDLKGELEDWVVVEASDKAFVVELEKVIADWLFDVPRFEGQEKSIVTELMIRFKSQVSEDRGYSFERMLVMDATPDYRRRSRTYSKHYGIALPQELDQPLQSTYVFQPKVPRRFLHRELTGEAVFEFFVDEEGNVRLPSVEKTEGYVQPETLLIFQEAIEEWTFQPPTQNGKPAMVKVSQRIQLPTSRRL